MQSKDNDWITVNIPYGPLGTYESKVLKFRDNDTFCKRELNNPGTLIKLSNGDEFLIGHINKNRGICDDCTEFNEWDIVEAYKIIWQPDQ
jgi:hypothetical protein